MGTWFYEYCRLQFTVACCIAVTWALIAIVDRLVRYFIKEEEDA